MHKNNNKTINRTQYSIDQAMDPDTEVRDDFSPFIRVYKSGRVERLIGTDTVPPSADPSTGVISKDVLIEPTTGVSARLYLPKKPDKKLPVLVYYHGGAFCIGSAFSPAYHHWLTSLVGESNVIAVSVEYRLAPEHPLPAAYDDAWYALSWLAKHAGGESSENWLTDHADFGRVFVGGDSAGANITHHMAMLAGGEEGKEFGLSIRGAVLIHPYFSGRRGVGEDRDEEERFYKLVCSSAMDGVDDVRLNPLEEAAAPGLARLGCQRVMVIVAEIDILRERGRAYNEALKESGWNGEVEFLEHRGKEHVFHLFDPGCDEAVDLMECLVAFLNQ